MILLYHAISGVPGTPSACVGGAFSTQLAPTPSDHPMTRERGAVHARTRTYTLAESASANGSDSRQAEKQENAQPPRHPASPRPLPQKPLRRRTAVQSCNHDAINHKGPVLARVQAVTLGREHEIALGQPVDLMSPHLDLDLAP